MQYEKPPLNFGAQADLLLKRGMEGDRDLMIRRLSSVSYYRLSGYWFPFKDKDEQFRPGTQFEEVWNRYVFDRQLRLLVIDAIERIEVGVRTQLAYHHAINHGPFAYVEDSSSLPKCNPTSFQKFVDKVEEETRRSKERFVVHFENKYGDFHARLPIWMGVEVMSFGTVLSLYKGASHQVKQDVASLFGMPDTVFESWLLTLSVTRNICAHHARLWNRELGVKPKIPRFDNYPEWHEPVAVGNARVFAVLTICKYCLSKIASQSRWATRLKALIEKYPSIPIRDMGFAEKWADCPIWHD